jgi:hypothetical protein
VEIEQIKKVEARETPEGKSFIVTLKKNQIAESLHNGGRGNCCFYDSNKFEFFPVKKR